MPLSGGRRTIGKNVSEMRIAAGTDDLGSFHAMTIIHSHDNVAGVDRLEKAGPAGAGIEFRISTKQGQSTAYAGVNSRFLVVVESSAKGMFGSFSASDFVLLRCKLSTPFGVRLGDLLNRHGERAGCFSAGGSRQGRSSRNSVGDIPPRDRRSKPVQFLSQSDA